jgi:hypothetical protein
VSTDEKARSTVSLWVRFPLAPIFFKKANMSNKFLVLLLLIFVGYATFYALAKSIVSVGFLGGVILISILCAVRLLWKKLQ